MTSSPFAFSSDSEHRPGSDPLLFASQSPLLQTQDFRPSHSDMGSSQANNFFSATGNPMGSHSQGSLGLYPGPSMRSGPYSSFPDVQSFDSSANSRMRKLEHDNSQLKQEHEHVVAHMQSMDVTFNRFFHHANQQLAVIAAGITDLPANIAKSLSSVMQPPSTTTKPSKSEAQVVLLPQLERVQFLGVVHWGPDSYNALRKGKPKKEEEDDLENDDPSSISESSKGKTSTLSCYMEDEHGQPIPESQRNAARRKAKLFWNGFLKDVNDGKGTLPSSGQKLDLHVRDQFVLMMEVSYPWLRYYQNHWKANRIWINHYPNWYRSAVGAEGEVIDVDQDDADVQEPPRRNLKRRVVHDELNDPRKRTRVEVDESAPPQARRTLTLQTRPKFLAGVRVATAALTIPTSQVNPATSEGESPASGSGIPPALPPASVSENTAAIASTPGSSACAQTSLDASVQPPVSASVATLITPSASTQGDTEHISRAQNNNLVPPTGATDSQATSSSTLNPASTVPVLVSSDPVQPPTSGETSATNLGNISGSSTNAAPTPIAPKTPAPGKKSRKSAPKKVKQPKKMTAAQELCYKEWKKTNAGTAENAFEVYWKDSVTLANKRKYGRKAKKPTSTSEES